MGLTVQQTANRVGVSASNVQYYIQKLGAVGPRSRVISVPQPDCVRNGKPVRRFTQEEDEKILAASQQNIRLSVVARDLGRKRTSVFQRLCALSRHEALNEGSR